MHRIYLVCRISACLALVRLTVGVCPNLSRNPTELRSLRGRIIYTSPSSEADCRWKLPAIPSDHHAIQFYLKEANMRVKGRCGGIIILPGARKTCEASLICKSYVTKNSTCRINDLASQSYPECTGTIIHVDHGPQQDVQYLAQKTGSQEMSFTLLYKTVDCNEPLAVQRKIGLEASPALEPNPSDDHADSNNTWQRGNVTDPVDLESEALSSTITAIIAIIVILTLLLAATCFMLLQMYKRKQKAVTFQNPAVVAYVHDRFDADSASSYPLPIEYLEFPGSETATTSSESLPAKDIYEEIGVGETKELETTQSKERAYENVFVDSNIAMNSTANLVALNAEFEPDCLYAKVMKPNKTLSETETAT